jgi:ArsR family transcriptional regulator
MFNYYKVSKAMSDTNRIKIMQMLSDGEMKVTDVAYTLDVEENLASHHLRVLASLGFLKSDKKGREVFYKINRQSLVRILKSLNKNPTFKEILQESLTESK